MRHLTAPQNDKVTFGIVKNTISGQTANTDRVVYQQIEQVKQSVGKEIDEKIENATKLITGGTGGYFVIGLNEAGQPNEAYWMDAPTTEAATNVLRINQNGIGFSHNGIGGPYTNAWTIDGNLVASFITSGTMLADRIRGGSLEIGGNRNRGKRRDNCQKCIRYGNRTDRQKRDYDQARKHRLGQWGV